MSINYQWQQSKDNGASFENIAATGSTLQISHIKPNQHNFFYRCRVNRDGSKKYRYSDPAKLTVLSDISLGKLPSNISIDDGNLDLSPPVSVDNSATTSFQWQYSDNDGTNYYNLASATGSGLTLTGLSSINNNWLYRLQAKSYYYSGIVNAANSNSVLVNIETDLPKLQIWRQPQHYYGTGQPEFEVLVASTGLNSNNIPNTFYDNSATDITYGWEYSSDGFVWQSVIDHPSGQNKIYPSNNHGYQYRVNVSKSGHTIKSKSASIIKEFCIPYTDNFDYESKIFGMNHFNIKSSAGVTLGLFSNCPQILETAETRTNIKLLSLESEGDKYELILNMTRSTDSVSAKPYNLAIEDVSLFKNAVLQQKASTKFTTEIERTEFSLRRLTDQTFYISQRKQGKETSSVSAGAAGISYGNGYCINLCNPLHGNNLDNKNYKNFIINCIGRCSRKKYGAIKVGVTSTGNSSVDTNLLSKLPTQLLIKSGNKKAVDLTITYEMIGEGSAITKQTLDNIDVVILNNGYNWNSRFFSQSEQEALKYFVNDGGGLLTSEWVLWNTNRGQFDHLKEVFAAEPTFDYKSDKKVRYYEYDSDFIINHDVDDDFKFAPASVGGATETTFTAFKAGSQLFYLRDPDMVTVGLKKSKFDILDLFCFLATETENTTTATLDTSDTFFEGSFYWKGKISNKIKIGGVLYWIYKSLIEYHRKADEGVDKPTSAWSLGKGLVGDKTDGINKILSDNGLTISDFAFSNLEPIKESPEQELTANDNFWKDISRLLTNLRPVNNNYREIREFPPNQCNIVKQPNYPIVPVSGTGTLEYSVTHPSEFPILYLIQKASGNEYVNIKADNFTQNIITLENIQSSDIGSDVKYRVLFESIDNYSGTPSDVFNFSNNNQQTNTTTESQNFSIATLTDGNGVFVKPILASGRPTYDGTSSSSFGDSGNLISWQYSYDNINFYNTTSGVSVSGNSSIITLGSGNHDKNIRYSFHPILDAFKTDNGENIKSIAYSTPSSYDPQEFIRFGSNIGGYYTSGGQQYCTISVFLKETGLNDRVNSADVTWEQYSFTTNTYETLPDLSGNRAFGVSGVKVSLVDTYKFRAKINNRIFYLS